MKRSLLVSACVIACITAPVGAFAADGADVASPANDSARMSHVLVLLRANKDAEAAQEARRIIADHPRCAEAHNNLGLALAKLGQTQAAVDELNLAIKIDPQLDAAWLTLAGLEQSIGHIDPAIALYTQYLQRFQSRTDLSETRARVKRLLGGLKEQSEQFHSARNQNEAIHGGSSPLPLTSEGVLQVPAKAAGTDDYLDDVTANGVRFWTHMPIRVCIHDARGVPGYHQQWGEILTRSFNDWAAASQGAIKLVFVPADSAKDHRLDCYFVAYAEEHQQIKNDAEAGEANLLMNQDGITSGTLYILTHSLSSVLPLTDNRMRVICLHEIGHALGLAGHTTNPDDIMFYSTSFKDEWRNLDGRDARTIQRLYASH